MPKVETERAPRVADAARIAVEDKPAGFSIGFVPDEASFFIGRKTPVPSVRPELVPWEETIFGVLTRNSVTVTDYFLNPAPRVVEMGTRIEL